MPALPPEPKTHWDITLKVPRELINLGDRPEKMALKIAIWAYLEEYGGEGYDERGFLDYARTYIEERMRATQEDPIVEAARKLDI